MKKEFNFILMYTKIIIAFSIKADDLVGAMEELLRNIKEGAYIGRIEPVKRNIQIGLYKWEKVYYPGGIIIADNYGEERYQLEFSDDKQAVMLILAMDIAELRMKKKLKISSSE